MRINYFILLTSLLFTSPVFAKLYKWVDESGKVHYSDKVPPKHTKQARQELNQNGIIVKSKGRAKTNEEIARDKELKKLRDEQALILEKQQATDRVLLRTFRSIDDLILTRDGKLETIDQQIRVSKDNIKRLKQHLNIVQTEAARRELKGLIINKKITIDIENTNTHIQDTYKSIIRKERNKELISQNFNRDIERFTQLKKLQNKNFKQVNALDSKTSLKTSFVKTILNCKTTQHCDSLWIKARNYGLKYANTQIQTDSNQLFITAPPRRDEDMSITISRITTSSNNSEIIFFDIQCKESLTGTQLCESKKVYEIRNNFIKVNH